MTARINALQIEPISNGTASGPASGSGIGRRLHALFERIVASEHKCAPPARLWEPVSFEAKDVSGDHYVCPECGQPWRAPR